jgi:hypothetical protein
MALIAIDRDVRRALAEKGFAWIPQAAWTIGSDLQLHWQRLCQDWDHLELDRYLKDDLKFRLRRYGSYCWSPAADSLIPLAPEPYFQPEEDNSYAGGIARDFAPLLPETMSNPFLHALVRSMFACLPITGPKQAGTWEVRIHQIRIVATPEEPGLPAPEGIHQDGTDFLTLHLVRRRNVAGGESTIYDLNRKPIQRFTMRETLDSLILEDPRIMHGVTPVHSADGQTLGIRDLMGVDFIYRPRQQENV